MILLIEDEEILRFSFTTFLVEAGYQVTEADSLAMGRKVLRREEPELVLCDILFPDGNGIELLEQIHQQYPGCPVIMITGQPSLESATGAVRLGAYDYLIKPVTKDVLLHVVGKAMELRTARIERCQADRDKQALGQDLEAIFSSVNEAIITVDSNMRILRANQAVHAICRCLPADLIGKKLEEVDFQCARSCLRDVHSVVGGESSLASRRIECRRKDRPDQVVMLNTSRLQRVEDHDGGILVIHDLTREHNLEQRVHRSRYDRLIGGSRPMLELYNLLDDLKSSDATVLIIGESGTGKELVAESLHSGSRRAAAPFIRVNCSALSETLLESELFGHVRGAFTGAVQDKIGRFEAAQGGSILLDEIGDISPAVQLKLLRVLQEKVIERVGDSRPVPVDVRVLAATNRDIRALMISDRFRQDLYYRLNVVGVHLAPLRERNGDIPLLVDHFLAYFNRLTGKCIHGCSDAFLDLCEKYPWPGNVREMEHAIEHAFVLCHEETLALANLPAALREWRVDFAVDQPKEELSVDSILQTIEASGGNKALAARKLGISRRTIYRRLQGGAD